MSYGPRAQRKAKRAPLWPLLFAVMLVVAAVVAAPSFMYEEKPPLSRPRLVYRGGRQFYPVVVEANEAYVPFAFVKDVIDPDAFAEDGMVIVTTKDKVVKLKTDSLTAYVNQHPVELQLPITLEGDEPYIPASALELLYPVTAILTDEAGTFIVRRTDAESTVATSVSDAVVRVEPSILSRRIAVLPPGREVELFETKGGWVNVQTRDGIAGWMPKGRLSEPTRKPAEVVPADDYVPAALSGDRVSLVWEQVDWRTPDTSSIGPMSGLNVVSPTWFRLGETPGEVENYADPRYVSWAHSRGYKVWALFSNSFELQRTRTVLRDSDLRDKVISQILVYAKMYSLDGINLDFENVYQDDAPYLTQFVRELTPLLHEMGLTVSMDVTVKSKSPTWSLCYERSRLAEVLDYMMLMAYDQYAAGSKVAGPNSALTWVDSIIRLTLEEIPAEKLVLGMPFYMRLWKESRTGEGVKVSQQAIGMRYAQEWLREQGVTPVFDEETGLQYAEKSVGQDTWKLWVEDAASIAKRLELAESYGLAGVAAWRRGFETPEVWDAFASYTGR
ncbi:MAG: glycosyl hydrolase family 18 protein [Bacillota bacterium]